MADFISLCFLLVIFALILHQVFKKPPKPNNVIPFRTVHRIEWLRKRRANKLRQVKK